MYTDACRLVYVMGYTRTYANERVRTHIRTYTPTDACNMHTRIHTHKCSCTFPQVNYIISSRCPWYLCQSRKICALRTQDFFREYDPSRRTKVSREDMRCHGKAAIHFGDDKYDGCGVWAAGGRRMKARIYRR